MSADKKHFDSRKDFIEGLKERGNNPYPHRFDVTQLNLTNLIATHYEKLKDGEVNEDAEISLAGRILERSKYGKLTLFTLDVDGTRFQLVVDSRDSKMDETALGLLRDNKICKGDIVGVTGHPGKSKKGEFNIFPKVCTVLSHCLHLLPNALKDPETRYGKRYLDMIVNSEVRRVFQTRAKIISFIRSFLDERDFIEVETSILNKVPGLGGAVPFVASHDKMNLYMRIAPELGLKQLVVGGLNRVYEIGKQFRCEDIDRTHHPEFTSCELYMAYSDYEDLMSLTEDLLSGIVKMLTGGYILKYQPSPNDETVEIDFTPPFRRVKMVEELECQLGIEIPRSFDEETNKVLKEACQKNDVVCKSQRTTRMLDKLSDRFIGDSCINPTFILNHPQIMSPMAKHHRSEPGVSERFELFVNKSELINAYTELNDAMLQRKNFEVLKEELELGDRDKDKTFQVDETFLTALEYGLPPTAGWGIGIDRLVMLLTNTNNIRDVICFPLSKKAKFSN